MPQPVADAAETTAAVTEDGMTGPDPEMLRALLGDALAELSDARLRHVLARRLNLDGAGPATLAEVGADLGVRRERIRQLQNKAQGTIIQVLSHSAPLHELVRQAAGSLEREVDVVRLASWIHKRVPAQRRGHRR